MKNRQIILLTILVILSVTMPLFTSCKDANTSTVNFAYDKETVPSMHTDSVRMLISDSGLIKYKMLTKTWDMYDEAKDPFHFFPDGLYLEQFDTSFHVVVTIKADTAWNFTRRKLWRLKGHVFVRNSLGETFSSDELFWNQQQQKIYSDKLVEINRPEKGILLAKNGLVANQQMTEYEFMRVGETGSKKTLIYVNENEDTEEQSTKEKAE